MALITGYGGGGDSAGIQLLTWFFAVFTSILIHELGHMLMIRRFGREAHIVLYMMGGLAIEGRPSFHGGSPWSFEAYSDYRPRARTPLEQILISAAGPGIQLLLAAVVIGIVYATGGYVRLAGDVIPLPIPRLGGEFAMNENLHILVWDLLYINIFWALINLLPVLPLDGGQIAMQILVQRNPWNGMQQALWLSVITGGAMAVFSLSAGQQFTMLLFASLAV